MSPDHPTCAGPMSAAQGDATQTFAGDSSARDADPTAPESAVAEPLMHWKCPLCAAEIGDDPEGSRHRHGKFGLIRRLGRGGFGEVWRAKDFLLDRHVALKIALASRPAQADSAYEEARKSAKLQHPNIVTIFEVTTLDRLAVIVSEFIEGKTLQDALAVGRPTPRESAQMLILLANAVEYAHSCQTVHRDLKPANVMLRIDNQGLDGGVGAWGRPMIMDYGLAVRLDQSPSDPVGGTPRYMSPEQARLFLNGRFGSETC